MELAPFAEMQVNSMTRAHHRYRKIILPRRRDTSARHKGAAQNILFVLECKTNENARQPPGLTRAHRFAGRSASWFGCLRDDCPPRNRERDRTGHIDWRCLRDACEVGVEAVSQILHGRANSRARRQGEAPLQRDSCWQRGPANDT